ncbi:hypothetical protein ONS95_004884 [Cadophora gregata]|uniref:uncharacterized protein n=1 Tax=Cadophora gregata TaxID=51156 RepID=UPI0026DAFCAC|nr:uncharacterized protein ONS95_004884 [Cadophora gregata]KAK0104598.1 hypothetical protein ONS95_004884 [Cadophora gregata]
MASPLVSKAPQCMSCIRRMTSSFGDAFHFPARQQARGKKKLASAKIQTVKVHLLQNIPGYGRRGAVIPVTSGVMRNIWYPKKMAEYLTMEKLQNLGLKKDSVVERDSTFQTRAVRKLEKKQEKQTQERPEEPIVRMTEEQPSEPIPQFELDLLSPEQATTILENLLPSSLDFYRTPISLPTPKRVSPSIPASSAISAAAEGNKPGPGRTEKRGIYGSVSTSDIAANLKAILAEDEEGIRVVLSHENISFVEETEDRDRVKHLGVFDIDIRLEGAPESVRRTIQVSAQD